MSLLFAVLFTFAQTCSQAAVESLFRWIAVAPRAGAWIETSGQPAQEGQPLVAPRAGAWIETCHKYPIPKKGLSPLARGRGLKQKLSRLRQIGFKSPLARGRGLKPGLFVTIFQSPGVAPRAGAWIETQSHPASRGRPASPLARGRGLKPTVCSIIAAICVAPRAGAWIETKMSPCTILIGYRRPSRGGVD